MRPFSLSDSNWLRLTWPACTTEIHFRGSSAFIGNRKTSTRSAIPPTTFEGFAPHHCQLSALFSDVRRSFHFDWSPVFCTKSARFLHHQRPVSVALDTRQHHGGRKDQSRAETAARCLYAWLSCSSARVSFFFCQELKFLSIWRLLSHCRLPIDLPISSSRSLAFPYRAEHHRVINEYNNSSYAPSTESNNFAQGPLAADISNRYVAGSFDDSNALRYDANASLSAQPQIFSTGAFDFTSTTYAEGGYGGVPAALGHSDPSVYPFATDAAFNGTDTFATASYPSTNGHDVANNPLPMTVFNNPIVPLDIGLMTEGPIPLPPSVYNTGQASANYPFPMHGSHGPILPMDMGLMTASSTGLPQNI